MLHLSFLRLDAPHPGNQSVLFQWLRWRLLSNSLTGLFHGSSMRVLPILFCSGLVWAAVYAATREAFHFTQLGNIPVGGDIVGAVYDLLFLTLTVALVFSTSIILFTSLYASEETGFLLSTPAAADQIYAYKFQSAVAFSSWAFLLLGSPVLVAYGQAFGAPWYFYPLLFVYLIGFVLLPGSLGGLICLLTANYFPRRRKQILIGAAVLLLASLALWIYKLQRSGWDEAMNPDFVQQLLGQFALARGPLAPNHWLTRGLQATARGDGLASVYYLALVWSNGLVLYVLAAWSAAQLYRRAYNRVATGGTLRRRYGGSWLDGALASLVGFLDPQTRLLIVKDFRTFRRDPAQFAQVLIFTILASLYFLMMRHFYDEDVKAAYRNVVSLINLAAVGLLLCAYTGRFIFPMLSLEGRKFWILGLLPLPRERLLWGKFAFSATFAGLVGEILVVFGDFMLAIPHALIAVHALTMLVLALGLSGLSVGLGAWIPNFHENDPSKIAVGFGGTLNLVAGLLFILLIIACMVVPSHIRAAVSQVVELSPETLWWCGAGIVTGVALGLAAMLVPLRIGARALQHREF